MNEKEIYTSVTLHDKVNGDRFTVSDIQTFCVEDWQALNDLQSKIKITIEQWKSEWGIEA